MLRVCAVVCPPLAVLLTGNFSGAAANVALSLLLFLPGVLHAWSVVERHETERRNRLLLDAIARFER
jgi:uncharacterized membrane protein YqaE (UPF0057 family)